MRVGIQGWGSEGDLRPLVALAGALRRRGHTVQVVLTPVDGSRYDALCRRLDVPVRLVPESMDFALDKVAADGESVDPLKISRELVEHAFYPFLDALYDSALALCAESDVVLWHYSSWYTLAAAQKTKVPQVAVHFYPGLAPSRIAPPGGFPNAKVLNPWLWRLVRTVLDLQFRKRPSAFFQSKGLPPIRHVLPDLLFSDQLNLHAISEQLCPRPADWGPEHQVCGQFQVPDEAQTWEPSAELSSFLAAGERPVFLSLGSMEHMAPRRARDLLVSAARSAKVRAIIQTKRDAQMEGRDGDLYFVPWVPHGALLPRCVAMVHHGGAGTSHSALRAGRPAVVVPFIFEQQVWGSRLRAIGVAPKPLSFWKARPETLGASIREVVTNQTMVARAKAVAEKMAGEDGARTAAELLERRFAHGDSKPREVG